MLDFLSKLKFYETKNIALCVHSLCIFLQVGVNQSFVIYQKLIIGISVFHVSFKDIESEQRYAIKFDIHLSGTPTKMFQLIKIANTGDSLS